MSADDGRISAYDTALANLASLGESAPVNVVAAIASNAQAWATLALADEVRALREALAPKPPEFHAEFNLDTTTEQETKQ